MSENLVQHLNVRKWVGNSHCTIDQGMVALVDRRRESVLDFDVDARAERASLTFLAVPDLNHVAMMLAGFGLVGGAMRARRRTAVTFA